MRMNIPMVKKNSKGIACNIRLMIYLPMSASDKQEVGTANVGDSVPYFLRLCHYFVHLNNQKSPGWTISLLSNQRFRTPACYKQQVGLLSLGGCRAGSVI